MSLLVLSRKPRLDDLAGWVGEAAAETVVLTSTGPDDAPDPRFRAVHRVADYSAASTGACALDLAREHGVRAIASLNEVDVLRAAAVRQLLGLPGQDLACATAFRDKHLMKAVAATHHVPVPAMGRARDLPDARRQAERIGYPVVVKPVDGGGAVGVHRVPDAAAWSMVPPPTGSALLVEAEVAERGFYVVDGLTREGEMLAGVVLDMGRGALDYRLGARPVTGCSVPPTDPRAARVLRHAAAVLAALPPLPRTTAFHLEAFEDPSGELVLCEIACRAGGVGHAPTFRLVTGIDLEGASVRGQLDLPEPAVEERRHGEAAFVGFPRQPGVLTRHPAALSHPAVVDYQARLAVGVRSGESAWAGDNAAVVQLRTEPWGDIAGAMAAVIAEYDAGTTWELEDQPEGSRQ